MKALLFLLSVVFVPAAFGMQDLLTNAGNCMITPEGYAVRIEIEKVDNQLIKREFVYRTRNCRQGTVGAVREVNYWIRSFEHGPDTDNGREYILRVSPQGETMRSMADPNVFNQAYDGNKGPLAYRVCPNDRRQLTLSEPNDVVRTECIEESAFTYPIRVDEYDNGIQLPSISGMSNVFLSRGGEPTRGTAHGGTNGAGGSGEVAVQDRQVF